MSAVMVLTAACGTDPAPSTGCVAGQTIACACQGGTSGVQTCLADRSYGTCACAGSDAGAVDVAADVGSQDAPPLGVDTPPVDAPVVDIPVADLPAADSPLVDIPVVDIPVVDVPVVDIPVVDVPVVDIPVVDIPMVDVPVVDASPVDATPPDAGAGCPAVSIGAAGGTVSCAGASVVIPAGALSAAVPVQITATGTSAPTGYTGYSPVFRFEPAGTAFAVPARVSIPFSGDTARAALFWSRPTGSSGYERIGGLAAGGALTGSVTHFSTGFVADGVDFTEAPERSCTVTRLLEGRTVSPSGIAMFFTAEDCLGRPLTDLTATDFVVREDGTALSSEASATLITRVGPQVFVSLVLDLSASTNAFLPQLTAAAAQFITTLQTLRHLPVQIGIQVFAGESGLTEWQSPTVDTARLLARLDALSTYRPADPGSTNLYGAIISALGRQATAETAFRTRNAGGAFTTGYVVLFTDGGDTAGLRTQADAVAAVRGSTDRTLAVGLAGGDYMPSVLSALAPAGVLTAPDTSTLSREFNALASRIAAEFRTLYLLGYCSARRAGEHTVTVSVAGGTTAPAASYGFSAATFGPGCSASTFTAACAAADQCGGLGCGACDDRTTLCDGPSRRCIDDCVTANRCGGQSFTNPLGYTQVCPDRLGATACGGACVDVRTSVAHCGRCGNACAAGTPCVAGVCEPRPPRAIAPLSTSTVTSQQPTLRWLVGANTESTGVEICRDRAMTRSCLAPVNTVGTSARPPAPLAPGVWYWRLTGMRASVAATAVTPVWQFTVGARSAPRDTSWTSSLDVNGDGFADMAVGSSDRAYLYPGSATGVATTGPSFPSNGSGVFSAGDVNGDGFGDLLTGASFYRVLGVFLGGPTGLGASGIYRNPDLSFVYVGGPAALGDVNGDGYADVALGAAVYLGSASGPSATATPLNDPSGRPFGNATPVGVGDVDGDGFADVVMSVQVAVGISTMLLYRGSASGLPATGTAIPAPSGAMQFGSSYAAAGDVNGDGLNDVLIAARGSSQVFLYLGAATGLGATPIPLSGYGNLFYSGGLAAAGDLNGDGYSDVVVGSGANYTATIHFGSATGVSSSPTILPSVAGGYSFGVIVAGLGDVDGDGFGELAVGSFDSSRVFYYRGGASGVPATPTATFMGPTNVSYGGSIARAPARRPAAGVCRAPASS